MLNRPLNAVIVRLAIVAAALALLMLVAPVASAQQVNPMEVTYAENDTVAVGTYRAVDPEGEDIEWSVSEEDDFAISSDGVLTFKKSPDFETMELVHGGRDGQQDEAADRDNHDHQHGGGRYGHHGPAPAPGWKAGNGWTSRTRTGTRPAVMWQWSKSSDMSTWEDISGATVKSYTPQERGRG